MTFQKHCLAASFALTSVLSGCGNTEQIKSEIDSKRDDPDIYLDYLHRDVRDDIFYFVLPDRFANGDPANDSGDADKPVSYGGFKPDNKAYYHGGDLKGLEHKLDYLQEMGITAIWMTPILRNRAVQGDSSGYHGYWIVDFTEIDPHLGSNQDLKSLIDKAHQKGIKVFFDIITNHTADIIRYRECHDEQGRHLDKTVYECEYKSQQQINNRDTYTPFIPAGQETVKIPAWLNEVKYYNNQGDSFWQGESAVYGDFAGLDDLDTRQIEVVNGFIDIYKHIVSEFKPDGFRIDTVKHVDLSFWQAFSPAIMAHAQAEGIPNFHIFGEVYDTNPAFLSRFTTAGKLPAILDFAFQARTADVFVSEQPSNKLATLFDEDDYYKDTDSNADNLLTFVGNHDMGRIGLFLNQSLPLADEQEKTQRSILAHAFMFFARGIPVIYYGDEQGFTGDGNDQAAREDMMPSLVASYNDNNLLGSSQTTADDNFNQSQVIYQSIAGFSAIYKQHQALRRGIHLSRYTDKHSGIYAFSRIEPESKSEYLLAFNPGTKAKSIELAAGAESYELIFSDSDSQADAIVADNQTVSLNIPALSFVIYKAAEPWTPGPLVDLAIKRAEVDENAPERFNIEFGLESDDSAKGLHLYKVTTEYADQNGQFHLVSDDFTPPYRAKINLDTWQNSSGKLRVTLDNLAGEVSTQIFDLKD